MTSNKTPDARQRLSVEQGKTLLVLAGSYHDFVHWCKKNRVKPIQSPANPVIYLHSSEQLRGRTSQDTEIIFVGQWHTSNDELLVAVLQWFSIEYHHVIVSLPRRAGKKELIDNLRHDLFELSKLVDNLT